MHSNDCPWGLFPISLEKLIKKHAILPQKFHWVLLCKNVCILHMGINIWLERKSHFYYYILLNICLSIFLLVSLFLIIFIRFLPTYPSSFLLYFISAFKWREQILLDAKLVPSHFALLCFPIYFMELLPSCKILLVCLRCHDSQVSIVISFKYT